MHTTQYWRWRPEAGPFLPLCCALVSFLSSAGGRAACNGSANSWCSSSLEPYPWSHCLSGEHRIKKNHKHSCNHKCTLLRKLLFLFLRDSAEPCVTENWCFGNQYLRCSGYLLRLPCHGWGQIHCSPHRWPRSSCLHFHDSNSRHQWLLRQLLEHLKKDAGRNMSRLYLV